MENMLGLLLGAGHDFNHLVETYSFTELAAQARCMMTHRVEMLNSLIGPIVEGMGGEYQDATTDGDGRKRKRSPSPARPGKPNPGMNRSFRMGDYTDLKDKEVGLMQAFRRAGLPVRTIRTSSSPLAPRQSS